MTKHPLFRIVLDLLIALCVLHGWWFFAIPLCIAGALYFNYYFEALLAGMAYSALFGSVPALGIKSYLGLIVSMAIIIVSSISKSALRLRE